MITLRNKLYESLLDDEEDLVNDDISVLLQDKSFEFYDDFEIRDEWGADVSDKIPIVNNNELIIQDRLEVNIGHKPLTSYIPNIKTLNAARVAIYDNEDSKSLCKNIKTNRLNMYSNGNIELKDINLNITNSNEDDTDIYITGSHYTGSPLAIFNNVNIKTPNICYIHNFGGFYLPEFHNSKVNCKELHLEVSNSRLDKKKSVLNDIDSYIDTNYSINITDLKTGETKQKSKLNIKTVKTIVRNLANQLDANVTKFKDGTKITDIFKNIPDNTTRICVKFDDFEIIFKKDTNLEGIFKIKEYLIPLSDGWFMYLNSRRPINAKYRRKTNWGDDL